MATSVQISRVAAAGRQGPVSALRTVAESFLALPLSALADSALTRAIDLGCEHADVPVERIRTPSIRRRDARPGALAAAGARGLAGRGAREAAWGVGAGVVLTAAEAVRLAEEAVVVARASAAMNADGVELAPEPAYQGEWVSDYEIDT